VAAGDVATSESSRPLVVVINHTVLSLNARSPSPRSRSRRWSVGAQRRYLHVRIYGGTVTKTYQAAACGIQRYTVPGSPPHLTARPLHSLQRHHQSL